MTFSEIVYLNATQRYQDLIKGSLQNLVDISDIPSLEEYKAKSDKFRERIKEENFRLAKAYEEIQSNRNARLNAEEEAKYVKLQKEAFKTALDTEEAKKPLSDKMSLIEGKRKIDAATTKDEVERAMNDALTAIRRAQELELVTAKNAAKSVLDTEEAKKPLSDKMSLIEGKCKIDGAATKDEVESAMNDALTAIRRAQKNEFELVTAKNAAKSVLDTEEAKKPLSDKAPLIQGKYKIDSAATKARVESAMNDALVAIRKARDNERISSRKKVLTIFQFLLFASPLVLSVAFAIILFSNKEQISITSSFFGWCTGWVLFTISSLFVSIVLIKSRVKDWEYDDTASIVSSIIVAVTMIVSSAIVFPNAGKLSSGFDPPSFISFEVTDKTSSTSYSKYSSTISFNLINNSDVKVTYIFGEMKLYNGSTEVGSWNVYFNGEYDAGQSYTTAVEFDETDSTNLYDTSFADLGITYQITSMKFNGDDKEYEFDGKMITLKQASSSKDSKDSKDTKDTKDSEDSNNNDSSKEFGDVANYEITDAAALLKWLKNDIGNDVIIPDGGLDYISYTNNCTCYNADYSKSYIGSHVYFEISFAYVDTLVTNFMQKLINNGWTKVYDSDSQYEYKKGTMHIRFGDVQGSYGWDGETYYWNYYAFNVD